MRRSRYSMAPGRKTPWGLMLFLVFLLALASGVLLLNRTAQRHPRMEKQAVTVSYLPGALEGFRVLHMSDLHGHVFGEAQQDLRALVQDMRYRAVVMTGDMVGRSGDAAPWLDLLGHLDGDVPKLWIEGPADPPVYAETGGQVFAPWAQAAADAGGTYLDRPYPMDVGKQRVWFVPFWLISMDLDALEHALDKETDRLRAIAHPTDREQTALKVAAHRRRALQETRRMALEMLPEHVYIALSASPIAQDVMETTRFRDKNGLRMTNFPGTLSLVYAGHPNSAALPDLLAPFRSLFVRAAEDREVHAQTLNVDGVSMHVAPGLAGEDVGFFSFLKRWFEPPVMSETKLTMHYH